MLNIFRPEDRLALRMRLARAALLWERVWPAAWPALCVLGVFAIVALFDLLPGLPGVAHAVILALFAVAFAGAAAWGVRAARRGGWPDTRWRRAAASSRRAGCRTVRSRRSATARACSARRQRQAALGGAPAADGGGSCADCASGLAGCRPRPTRPMGYSLGSLTVLLLLGPLSMPAPTGAIARCAALPGRASPRFRRIAGNQLRCYG